MAAFNQYTPGGRGGNLLFTGVGGGGGASGSDVFGSRVGPTSPVTGPTLNQAFPNLSGVNSAASGALLSELTGQLSPQTMNSIMDAAATYGIQTGMPGSGLVQYKYPKDIGLTSEALQHQGLGDYSPIINTVSNTQTVNPSTMAGLNSEIEAMNKVNAAAPDPAAAGSYAQQLFNEYLNKMSGPAGGTGTKPWWEQGAAGNYYTPPIMGEAFGGSVMRDGSLMGVI